MSTLKELTITTSKVESQRTVNIVRSQKYNCKVDIAAICCNKQKDKTVTIYNKSILLWKHCMMLNLTTCIKIYKALSTFFLILHFDTLEIFWRIFLAAELLVFWCSPLTASNLLSSIYLVVCVRKETYMLICEEG